MRLRFCFGAALTGFMLLNAAQTAYSEDNGSFFGEQDGLFAISAKKDNTFADVGAVFVHRDEYVGSEETENRILPFVRADYKGRLFVNAATGGGVYWRNTDSFRFSTSVNWQPGRDSEDAPILEDQGDVTGSITIVNAARIYSAYGAFDLISSVPITGDFDGARFDALFSTEFLPFEGLRITPGLRATFGTSGWVNTFYGIDNDTLAALNNAPASLSAFDAGSGLIAFGVHTAAYWGLPHNFELVGVANYSNLRDDARDSPLSPENNGLTLTIGVTKQF